MTLANLVANSTISYIHHIHDWDEKHQTMHTWYDVTLEPPDSPVQTVSFTVGTFEQLEQVLTENGWTVEPDTIRVFNNQTGQVA